MEDIWITPKVEMEEGRLYTYEELRRIAEGPDRRSESEVSA